VPIFLPISKSCIEWRVSFCAHFSTHKQELYRAASVCGWLQVGGRAGMFVLDFLVTQLVGVDVMEMWQLTNPMALLAALLKEAGRPEPESRLLWTDGQNTIMSVYYVGIYVDKKLIGKCTANTPDFLLTLFDI